MNSSIFLAKLMGPVLVLIGGTLLLEAQLYPPVLKEFNASDALIFLFGLMGFIGGLAMVIVHNVWRPDWRLIITLLGWLIVAKSLILMLFPQVSLTLAPAVLAQRGFMPAVGAVEIVLGLILCVFGYRRRTAAQKP